MRASRLVTRIAPLVIAGAVIGGRWVSQPPSCGRHEHGFDPLFPLEITPAWAGPADRDPGPPALEDLDGEWTGSITVTDYSTTVKPAQAGIDNSLLGKKGVPLDMRGDANTSGGNLHMTLRAKGGQPWPCPFVYSGDRASCDTVINMYKTHFEAPVTRTADGVRMAGTWSMNLRGGLLRMSGTFTLAKPLDQDTEIDLLYPVGKSPKVFVRGWVFGARCTTKVKDSEPEDKSDEVEWSGTATFEPEKGKTSRPVFQAPGANKIILACAGKKRTFGIEAVSTTLFARLGDKAQVPADAHGCPACPHPAIGPLIMGSPSVLIDGRPAARVGDLGVHSACCGPNMWRVVSGSPEVLIDGRPAAKLGSATQHCGGMGRIVEASTGGGDVRAAPKPAPAASVAAPTATGSAPASAAAQSPITDAKGKDKTRIRTGPTETRVLRNTVSGNAPRSASSVFPDSELLRNVDGLLELLQGAALVTTLGPGAKETIKTPAGKIELGSQARIVRIRDEVDVAMLTGKAHIVPRSGAAFDVLEGSSVRFDPSGRKTVTMLSVADYPKTFGSYLEPSHPREPAASGTGALGALAAIPRWVYFAVGGGLVVFFATVGLLLAILLLRKPPPPRAGSGR